MRQSTTALIVSVVFVMLGLNGLYLEASSSKLFDSSWMSGLLGHLLLAGLALPWSLLFNTAAGMFLGVLVNACIIYFLVSWIGSILVKSPADSAARTSYNIPVILGVVIVLIITVVVADLVIKGHAVTPTQRARQQQNELAPVRSLSPDSAPSVRMR